MNEKIITKILMEVLRKNNWGIYFKGQAIQELPVSGEASMYRVNIVRDESFKGAISEELEGIVEAINQQGDTECQDKTMKGSSET